MARLSKVLTESTFGFAVSACDPGRDLASQLEEGLNKNPPGRDPIVVYATSMLSLSSDGEVFLCLNPERPDEGDALSELLATLGDAAPAPALLFIDGVFGEERDPFFAASLVGAAKGTASGLGHGVELVVSVRQATAAATAPPPLTRAFCELLREIPPDGGLSADAIYHLASMREGVVGKVAALAHVRGRSSCFLAPSPKEAERPEASSSRRGSVPPTELPQDRSFQSGSAHPPKIVLSAPPPPPPPSRAPSEPKGPAAARRISDIDEINGAELAIERARAACAAGEHGEAVRVVETHLEASPEQLGPLEALSTMLAAASEWKLLEQVYLRMLARAPRIQSATARGEVTDLLRQKLLVLYREELKDAAAEFSLLEADLADRPEQVVNRTRALELAVQQGLTDRAVFHQRALACEPNVAPEVLHGLFAHFQKARLPDEAFLAAAAATVLGVAEPRERFVFEEHAQQSIPEFTRRVDDECWALLEHSRKDANVDGVMRAVGKAAARARVQELGGLGRVPVLDPSKRIAADADHPVALAMARAGRLLGEPTPYLYAYEDFQGGLAPVAGDQPTVIFGPSLVESAPQKLAFVVARHLSLYAGPYAMLAYCGSLEELSVVFAAAIKLAKPSALVPSRVQAEAEALALRMQPFLSASGMADLVEAVGAFEAAGTRASIRRWVASAERRALRVGLVLSGDPSSAASVLRDGAAGLMPVEERIADLVGYLVSAEHHALRARLGVAIEP